MDVIRQNADGHGLKRTLLFRFGVGAPQAFNLPHQQIAAPVGERHGEEEYSALDPKPTITRHRSFTATVWWARRGAPVGALAHPTISIRATCLNPYRLQARRCGAEHRARARAWRRDRVGSRGSRCALPHRASVF